MASGKELIVSKPLITTDYVKLRHTHGRVVKLVKTGILDMHGVHERIFSLFYFVLSPC